MDTQELSVLILKDCSWLTNLFMVELAPEDGRFSLKLPLASISSSLPDILSCFTPSPRDDSELFWVGESSPSLRTARAISHPDVDTSLPWGVTDHLLAVPGIVGAPTYPEAAASRMRKGCSKKTRQCLRSCSRPATWPPDVCVPNS